jgi:hypothetical protein
MAKSTLLRRSFGLTPKSQVDSLISGSSYIANLIKILSQADSKNEHAKLNETTISDNNGGRIIL